MKYFIASDIHGSLFYCKKMIECFKNENADKLVLLGDILYHGPRNDLPKEYNPKEVITLLNEYKNVILAVRGNCDTQVDQMVLSFPCLADYAIISEGKTSVYLTHGHVYNENNLPPLAKGDILLHGHTHVPVCRENDGYTYINPGSVSIPKENSHHGYMTLQNGVFQWKDFDGNIINEHKI